MPTWTHFGEGSYNNVYLSEDGKLVLKIQKLTYNPTDLYDEPSRSVRLWNEINADLTPRAYVLETEHGRGWVCPFIEGEQASDQEISSTLIKIFNQTGRVVVDACCRKNFLRTSTGKIVCVDVGMAVRLGFSTEVLDNGLKRQPSEVSLACWSDQRVHLFRIFYQFKDLSSTHVVKALLWIKQSRPLIRNVNFLLDNPLLVEQLARALDGINTRAALRALDKITGELHAANSLLLIMSLFQSNPLKNSTQTCCCITDMSI